MTNIILHTAYIPIKSLDYRCNLALCFFFQIVCCFVFMFFWGVKLFLAICLFCAEMIRNKIKQNSACTGSFKIIIEMEKQCLLMDFQFTPIICPVFTPVLYLPALILPIDHGRI